MTDPSNGNMETVSMLEKNNITEQWRNNSEENSIYAWRKSSFSQLIYEHIPSLTYNYVEKHIFLNKLVKNNIIKRESDVRLTEKNGIIRKNDVSIEKQQGTLRVVVLGDSVSAALPLVLMGQAPYTVILETLLNNNKAAFNAQQIEVLNFAVDGYTTDQEAYLLETKVGKFQPDMIILQYCLNDPVLSYTPAIWFLEHKNPPSYLLDFVLRRLDIHSSLLSTLNPSHPYYGLGKNYWDRIHQDSSKSWKSVVGGFAKISSYSKNIPVLLVISPLLIDENDINKETQNLTKIYSKVKGLGQANGFSILELREELSKYKASQLKRTQDDTIHYNELGHQVVAETIFKTIKEKQLLYQQQ
ncbi:MAG: SGNH/GDSL hydrolase family protein [Candidatus Magnetoovum sp. WYHC-5]|nr:SGNH/GDSL hydrolase family protein [Candidatus Magnetoovum sp. WYHC-5]